MNAFENLPTRMQRASSASSSKAPLVENTPPAPPANFEEAPLWTKFAYAQNVLGFILMLFSFGHVTAPETSYGGIAAEVCFLFAFFSYLTSLCFCMVLVYVKDAKDNKLIEISVMLFAFLAALMMAIAISIWGGDAANRNKTINMVPVATTVVSAVFALLCGIFAALELFNFGRSNEPYAKQG